MTGGRSMSELGREPGQEAAADAPAATAGGLLRQAREASGLHIAALAVSLKVPVKKLEALEADHFDLLPDAVFVRALASSVCRTLKVDPAPILAKLPHTSAPRLAPTTSGINTPFRAPSDGPGPSMWDQVTRPAVLAVLALLMGALVLIFLPDIRTQVDMNAGVPEAAVMPPPGAPVNGTAVQDSTASPMAQGETPVPAGGEASATGQAAAAAPAAELSAAAASVALAPSASISTPAVASPTLVISPGAASAASAGTAAGIVVFKARVESWVEVTDARGAVVLRRILAAGEATGATGALPLSVVVGRADSTEVQVRGKPLDLAPLSRDNVARFEVK